MSIDQSLSLATALVLLVGCLVYQLLLLDWPLILKYRSRVMISCEYGNYSSAQAVSGQGFPDGTATRWHVYYRYQDSR